MFNNLDLYLNPIIDRKGNELVKVITDIRRRKTHHRSFRGRLCFQSWKQEILYPIRFCYSGQRKMDQETASLDRIDDSFKKIIIVRDIIKPWANEKGYLVMSIYDFFLKVDNL